ncbi:hypothetical protein [Rubripirellula amarantea]|nr:hypothetical protein [Rubripirellula amarantea]
MNISTAKADQRRTPELVREFTSPSGEYRLLITGHDDWRNPRPSAELSRLAKRAQPINDAWKIDELPHRLGPAAALVFDDGTVVLIDEWVRTPSPISLMVIDKQGIIKATHSFDDLAKVSGKSPAQMVESAKQGAWQSSPPIANHDAMSIRFFTDNIPILLNVKTGKISTVPSSD